MNDMENKNLNAVEKTPEREYTLRRLKDRDLYPMLDIIGKVMPEDVAPIVKDIITHEKSLDELGGVVLFKVVTAVLRNIPQVHDELYSLLSDLSGIPAEEIGEMKFGTTPMMIWDIVSDVKNADFFEVVSRSF